MHCCLLLLTEKIPTKKELKKIMKPYYEGNIDYDNDDLKKYPFTWDWWQIGGRYGGLIKYKLEKEDYVYLNHNLNNVKILSGLFDKLNENYRTNVMSMFNDKVIEETDFVNYLGYTDKILYCDGAYLNKCDIGDLAGYYCLDAVNNKVIWRKKWDGETWLKNDNYDNELQIILNNGREKGYFLTVIDIHN